MKKFFAVLVGFTFVFGLVGGAMAVPKGKQLVFDKSKEGKVTFDGKKHIDAGLACKDCHPAVFKMKKSGDKMTMADMEAGKLCGACHNDGKKTFSVKAAAKECAKCHKK